MAELGLRLEEAKQLTAALQAQMVPAQVAILGECLRSCVACGSILTSKGHYQIRFRSLFGDVPLRVRRRLICPCQGGDEAKSSNVLDFGGNVVAPELAYVTARYAALVPFGKVAAFLSELLPISGTQHASTVRNRTRRVGETIVRQQSSADTAKPTGPVMIGLDGGYVRNRHGSEGRHFEGIAGKVVDVEEIRHRFAFVRNAPVAASDAFKQALNAAGVNADTPATVLCHGDAGLWRLQRAALPDATVVLDWWHLAVRFEYALQAARSLERAKWRLWHGRWPECQHKLAALCRWTQHRYLRDVAGIGRLQRHVTELLGYLERNQDARIHYAARRRHGKPISTAFMENAVNEIVAKRMNKKQQIRWTRMMVQPFLNVRTAVLNGTLENVFRQHYLGFRPANDKHGAKPGAA